MSTPYKDPDYQPQRPQISMPRVTPVVKALLIANAVVFVLQLLLESWGPTRRIFNGVLVLDVDVWRKFSPFFPVWQLGTYGFMHSLNSLMHLAGNMMGLYFFGTMLESYLGSRKFCVAYFMALIGGGLLHLLILFATSRSGSVVGASGGVLAILVACGVLFPRRTVLIFFFPVQLVWLVVFFVAGDAFMLIREWQSGLTGSVAHWVHLGGAAIGFCGIKFGWFQWDPVSKLATKRAAGQVVKRVQEDQRFEQVLSKIHTDGMTALSSSEKELLKRVSKRRQDA
jgi:membrane associated rhomboid family serine protease